MDSDDENELEQIRRKNELAKEKLLKELGVLKGIPILVKETKVTKTNAKRKNMERTFSSAPVRKSPRLSHQPVNLSDQSFQNDTERQYEVKMEEKKSYAGMGQMVPVNDETEVKACLQDLLPYLKQTVGGHTTKSIKKSLDDFKNSLKKYSLSNVRKVGYSKTFSLTIHPSESRILVVTGDADGYLSFWDVNNPDSTVDIYRPHKMPIFCLSVCPYNPLKLYFTAIDGVVGSCDLEKREFNEVYIEENDHTAYHSHMSPHTLLVAHGRGEVGLVDIRVPKNAPKFWNCHERSVRTVQRHPLNENEFVTASAVGEVCLWDVRKTKHQKPLLLLPHPKIVRSAFYSPGGGMLLTSCIDDHIRIYSSTKSNLITSIKHNMQTGRWLRPFHAVWHPTRDDVFVIGSLNKPRQVDVYGIHGLPLKSLQSPNLSTVLSNCNFHKSLEAIVGANNSGYVHVFQG